MNEQLNNLGPRVLDIALKSTKGDLGLSQSYNRAEFAGPLINTLATPQGEWAKTVDEIESPFAPIYDAEEYDANSALTLMGFNELRFMLKSLGISSSQQTAFDQQPLQGKQTLVVGCGPGREVVMLSALGSEVEGLDITGAYLDVTSRKVREASNQLGRELPVRLYKCPAESFQYGAESYDNISSLFGVLNHVEDWKGTVTKIAESIKVGGSFVTSFYGSNEALVFRLLREGKLNYAPSILVRRVNGGIQLGESDGILPANFPYPNEIAQTLNDAGLKVTSRMGSLRLASLFPKDPTPENIQKFLKLVQEVDPVGLKRIEDYQDIPNSLLLATFLYDKNPINQESINDYAYVAFSARKEKRNE